MRFYLMLLGLLLAPAGLAAWDEGYDPYGASTYPAEGGGEATLFEEPLGVDPLYSTPSSETSSNGGQHAFIPDDVYVEVLGNMSLKSPHARTRLVNFFASVPLTDPRRAVWMGWHLDAHLSARVTWLHTKGNDVLDEDSLYTMGLNMAVSHAVGSRGQFQLGFVPQLSTDFDVMSHENFYWGGYAAFSARVNDRFRYTVGLAFMPDYYDNYVFPVLNVCWRYSQHWELRVQASRLSAVWVGGQRFEWGPFFQWNSGVWTVRRKGQTRQFRMTNCILGAGMTYNLTPGSSRVLFLADLGCSFYNTFRVRDKGGDHTLERYRAHPGLYARIGFRVQF